eukprot:TRINITY_DN8642_c0_g1_i1.p1 TRINITY_DN8642_c0_g1~~TRINITY_DN8642_c0_g1_i1.p1  ORF type:complete len:301 (-),score=56.84 TRINITY_DN8642_c0_g1_i1:50-952(-)
MSYLPAEPNGLLTEPFPNIFYIDSERSMAPSMVLLRSMIVIRNAKNELSLINSIRLSSATEQQLLELGDIKYVIRLGAFHHRDDRYYVDTFGAEYWSLEGLVEYDESEAEKPGASAHSQVVMEPDVIYGETTKFPFDVVQAIVFRTKLPECVLIVKNPEGGNVLLTADAVQNSQSDPRASFQTKVFCHLFGFYGRSVIGPGWLWGNYYDDDYTGPSVADDFERVLAADWTNLLSGHGVPGTDGQSKKYLHAEFLKKKNKKQLLGKAPPPMSLVSKLVVGAHVLLITYFVSSFTWNWYTGE